MQMTDPAQAKSLAQAIFDNNVFEPIYARMLVVGDALWQLGNRAGKPV